MGREPREAGRAITFRIYISATLYTLLHVILTVTLCDEAVAE